MVKISSANFYLKTFGLLKIPLIAFVTPKIVELDDEKVVVRVKKNWRTKNHFGSMYFGALAVGADIAAGFMAFMVAKSMKVNPGLLFKDFSAEFLKRPDYDVYFICRNGLQVAKDLKESMQTGERITVPAKIEAYTNYYNDQKELVSVMHLGVSVKAKP